MPTSLAYTVVDAFTRRAFGGNPAAVIALERWLPDAQLQQIAAEMALSETAFHAPEPVYEGDLRLRWFTPTTEVDLCGHATLATAFVLARPAVRFHTRSGALDVAQSLGGSYVLDFPGRVPERLNDPELLAAAGEALGATPRELWRSRNLLAVYDDAAAIRALAPDFRRVLALPTEGVIVTAPGGGGAGPDFVSRYFTPQHGIDEDPVTGSAHCTLGPYWSQRLGKRQMTAHQVSRRGGELTVEVAGDRVRMGGHAVIVARGELLLP
jgi:predicted PhzF superfamily epimerase YddE/YHI9